MLHPNQIYTWPALWAANPLTHFGVCKVASNSCRCICGVYTSQASMLCHLCWAFQHVRSQCSASTNQPTKQCFNLSRGKSTWLGYEIAWDHYWINWLESNKSALQCLIANLHRMPPRDWDNILKWQPITASEHRIQHYKCLCMYTGQHMNRL